VEDDVTMGDIDVSRALRELEKTGLIISEGDRVHIHTYREEEIMKLYRENCLLSDIDKDFYIQVASERSLSLYIAAYLLPSMCTDTEQLVGIPITLMRLIVEGRIEDVEKYTGTCFLISIFFYSFYKNMSFSASEETFDPT
jgi:hypothetical protein